MLYAAYGSNLHPARLAERIPSARLVGTAWLPDWSLRFHKRSRDRSAKCSILTGGEGVHLAIFDITAEDKLVLDGIEGLGNGYAGIALNLPRCGACVSYVAEASHIDDTLRPYDWYRELVLAGARFHGFPDDYVRRIERVQAIPDPDSARSTVQWDTVARVRAGSRIAADDEESR